MPDFSVGAECHKRCDCLPQAAVLIAILLCGRASLAFLLPNLGQINSQNQVKAVFRACDAWQSERRLEVMRSI